MKKDQRKIKTENGNVTNESRGHNEQNKQTTHTKTSLNQKNGEKNKLYKFTGNERTLTPQHHSTCISPETVPGLAFVLYRHVNLNKERNKRARCLRVEALASNAPLPHLADERRGGTETTEAQCLEVV